MTDRRRGDRRIDRVVRHSPRAAAGFAFVVGALGLLGWVSGVRWLTTYFPHGLQMAAGTAVAILFASIALWAVREPVARRSRWIVQICALAVCAIGGSTAFEYASGVDVGLDHPLAHAPWHWPPGRPSPQTVFALLLIGAGLLTIESSIRGRRPADYLGLAAVLLATTALLGYVFGIPVTSGIPSVMPYVGMSVPTAFAVMALGLGLVAARGDRGVIAVALADDAGGTAARRLLAGLLAFPPLAILVLAGAHAGWYAFSFASALVVVVALAESTGFILATARRLSGVDLEASRVARALSESEARVRILVEQAADAIFIADLDGRYTEVNDAACRMLGYTRAELLGKTIVDLLPAPAILRLAESKQRLLAGGVDVGEWTLRRHDGTYLPVEVSAKIFADGRWQGIARDISERKRAEAALARAAEIERGELEALNAASTAVSEALAGLRPHSDVAAVLRAIAEQARSLTGASYAAAAIGGDPDHGTFERWTAVGMSDEVAAAIGRQPRPVGVLGHVLTTGRLVRVANVETHPEFRGLPAAHPPITSFLAVPISHARLRGVLSLANKRGAPEFSEHDERIVSALAERVAVAIETAKLYTGEARQREWLQSIIDQLPEGVIVLDEHGDVKAINRVMRELALPDEGRTDPWGNPSRFDIRDRDQREVPFDDLPIVRALRNGETVRDRELLLRQADGAMVPISATAGPVRDDRQRITGAVVVVSDISERKELERLREEWIAVVAHDLRQPLNTILLWSDRLASLCNDDQQRTVIERIRGAGWRLNRMIEDLLDAARIAAHRLAIETRATDVVELARAAIDNARLGAPSAQLELVAAEHELAWVDPDRIQQVLANLISNAIKYGSPGMPVRVEIASRDTEVEIAVTNTGPAIAADELARLFARFSRTRHARDAKIPGIGLGLYICKGLVEAHGGRIWAESEHGANAFRFTLPRPSET